MSGALIVPTDSPLQFGQLAGELPRTRECGAHPDEGADDEDTHLDGAWAVQYVRCHDGVLGKCVWQVLDIQASLQDHNL